VPAKPPRFSEGASSQPLPNCQRSQGWSLICINVSHDRTEAIGLAQKVDRVDGAAMDTAKDLALVRGDDPIAERPQGAGEAVSQNAVRSAIVIGAQAIEPNPEAAARGGRFAL